MSNLTTHPPDICLILRAHAEQLWLTARVLPVLRQLERPHGIDASSPEGEDTGAALAYLEVLWLDARVRALEADAALEDLLRHGAAGEEILYEKARRYHAAVRRLRDAVCARVAAFTAAGCHETPTHEHAGS
ncbi:MAG TPA: hypothetical protein VED41_05930 [Solirubrobacteraceae bacterium]|nr:hypothetical protein [Solirubrobacteraceae bacterium]